MDRSIALLLIGLVFGGGIGFVAAAGAGITLDGHDHGAHGSAMAVAATTAGHSSHHVHGEMVAVPPGPEAPTLAISLMQDPASGWNLHIQTTNFRFAPEHASGPHVEGEGHAHVYVGGTKIARHYGPWLHIAELPAGRHTVEVTLSSNDHRGLAISGVPLTARTSVVVE